MTGVPDGQGCGEPIFIDLAEGHELCDWCGLGKNCLCCECREGSEVTVYV